MSTVCACTAAADGLSTPCTCTSLAIYILPARSRSSADVTLAQLRRRIYIQALTTRSRSCADVKRRSLSSDDVYIPARSLRSAEAQPARPALPIYVDTSSAPTTRSRSSAGPFIVLRLYYGEQLRQVQRVLHHSALFFGSWLSSQKPTCSPVMLPDIQLQQLSLQPLQTTMTSSFDLSNLLEG